jgi:hypothetical protein
MEPIDAWRTVCELLAAGSLEDACWAIDALVEAIDRRAYRPDGCPFGWQLRACQRVLEAARRESNTHVNPDLEGPTRG